MVIIVPDFCLLRDILHASNVKHHNDCLRMKLSLPSHPFREFLRFYRSHSRKRIRAFASKSPLEISLDHWECPSERLQLAGWEYFLICRSKSWKSKALHRNDGRPRVSTQMGSRSVGNEAPSWVTTLQVNPGLVRNVGGSQPQKIVTYKVDPPSYMVVNKPVNYSCIYNN